LDRVPSKDRETRAVVDLALNLPFIMQTAVTPTRKPSWWKPTRRVIRRKEATMLQLVATLIVILIVIVSASSANASIALSAELTNANENPPTTPTTSGGAPRPASFGTATFLINDAQTAMTFTATVFNIDVTGSQTPDVNDNLVAAHIHAAAVVTPTINAPVVWGFFGMPFNDNNPNDFTMTAFATGVGGTFGGKWDALEGNNTTLAAQLPNILSGNAYINFHTTQFGGGEIRGPLRLVPEPSTMVLMASAVTGLLSYRWRRSRRRR
jgi:hypothetical protein